MDHNQHNYDNGYYNNQTRPAPPPPIPSAATSANITPLRSGTPTSNPFGDETTSQRQAPTPLANPFSSPDVSRPPSSYRSSSSGLGQALGSGQRFFHSRRVKKDEVEKPWTKQKSAPKEKWVTIFPLLGILVGLGISGFLVWDGIDSVVKHNYCPVMDENFSGSLDDSIWTKEVEVGGFG